MSAFSAPDRVDVAATRGTEGAVPQLSIISPAYHERANIRPLVTAIAAAMGEARWELIVVDDDSGDGTVEEVFAVAHEGYPVRCIRRIGRRGLASAVVEGALAASAPVIAVIDADGQHDERLLPRMLALIAEGGSDLVVGSRHVEGGGVGDWSKDRQAMSGFATWCANLVLGTGISDPMSGFFAIRRDVFHACVHDLSQQGYKILLDIISSAPRELKITEIPYVFRNRTQGESKVDLMIMLEFLFLLIEKVTRGLIPPRFVLFSAVGGLGLLFHLAILQTLKVFGSTFLFAQTVATVAAMTLNYVVNNSVTYRSQRLRGARFVGGYFVFCLVCSIGGIANIGVADLVLAGEGNWALAGIAGALMSAVFNFGVATQFVWTQRRRTRRPKVIRPAG
ncbi:glycosyltransferase family 2 protein [Sphingomonas sp. CL5.1]|uniref:glycosyltransferase n=1 Tax=Sphingomonas sp. CL5.1 TaxID=2653203 RepID=UPI0015836D64|nr:glycosyltransferase family 2 protein [Sphingomonas sp. CL5.1]QKR99454.1 glycosyltransferase family 2 protein [Sphingomonas sp. CL5.1]